VLTAGTVGVGMIGVGVLVTAGELVGVTVTETGAGVVSNRVTRVSSPSTRGPRSSIGVGVAPPGVGVGSKSGEQPARIRQLRMSNLAL
jgi:hypothetical protein